MPEFFIILITVLLSGFFSGSEMAFVSANRLKLEIESRKNTVTGRALSFFNENPETFLTTTLVGNNIVNVLYATLMAIFLVEPVQFIYNEIFGEIPSLAMTLFIQTMIASVIILLIGEILFKAIFRILADFMVKIVAVPLRIFNFVLRPLIVISNSSSNVLVRWMRVGSERSEKVFRRQDVEMIFKELRDGGGSEDIDQDDSEILHNVLELSNKRVKETMVPRTEMVAIEQNAPLEELKNLFISSGYSKVPVYKDTIDDVVGVVFAYDLFNNPGGIAELIRPVKLIPSSKKSKDLLQEFRQSNISVAIVIDEYGGTAGMVTIEDLIEEVVGDIQDEYDKNDEVMKKIADRTYVVSGNVELDELEERYPEIELYDEKEMEFETLAGYIINHTGRIPKVNEEIQIGPNKFIISKATPSKLETVKMILGDEE
ncbi:MAG: HlyC/CorC family transporter [Balneolaceae bacterium]|nr:HlyC/CorC family transporter [Balneolaceae bacterium]MCH8548039.1 hemolysin family protein [Balneolaceae bacterium]